MTPLRKTYVRQGLAIAALGMCGVLLKQAIIAESLLGEIATFFAILCFYDWFSEEGRKRKRLKEYIRRIDEYHAWVTATGGASGRGITTTEKR